MLHRKTGANSVAKSCLSTYIYAISLIVCSWFFLSFLTRIHLIVRLSRVFCVLKCQGFEVSYSAPQNKGKTTIRRNILKESSPSAMEENYWPDFHSRKTPYKFFKSAVRNWIVNKRCRIPRRKEEIHHGKIVPLHNSKWWIHAFVVVQNKMTHHKNSKDASGAQGSICQSGIILLITPIFFTLKSEAGAAMWYY